MVRVVAILLGALLISACEPLTLPSPIQFERASADEVAHGQRVATVLGCRGCHGQNLQGMDWGDPEFGVLWTANLTRSVPRMSDRQLREAVQGGVRPGRPLWDMPSHLFTQLSGNDWHALVAYLRSVPPRGEVHAEPNFTPATRREIASGAFPDSRQQVAKEGGSGHPTPGPINASAVTSPAPPAPSATG
jgi:mono/diheme cytochrome c family protein